jgi:Protein of unknown function (DUF3102)
MWKRAVSRSRLVRSPCTKSCATPHSRLESTMYGTAARSTTTTHRGTAGATSEDANGLVSRQRACPSRSAASQTSRRLRFVVSRSTESTSYEQEAENSSRSLTTIVREIRGTFRNDIANIIRRGNLLQEAKDQLPHGEWLPWLQDNFEMDERTAQRAMAAAKFAATKSANVSDLNLTKSALYELSSNEYPPKVVRAALKEAKTKLVDHLRVYEINEELYPPPPPPETDELEKRAETDEFISAEAEAEAILDGPPPSLPPPATLPAVDFVLAQFNNAIKALSELQTKSVNRFAGANYTANDLRKIADFLHSVASNLRTE